MKILVCVKDKMYQNRIVQLIQKMECYEEIVIESYAALFYEQRKYDFAFLDLRIDAKRMLDMGKKLYEMNHCVNFYMYDDYTYIHDFFKAYGFQYLLMNQDELIIDELKRAYMYYVDIHCKVVLKGKNQNLVFKPHNIQYIENYHHCMRVIVGDHQFEGHIDDYEDVKEHLKHQNFIQVHPHYFVNAAYIMEYKSHEIRMQNHDFLPTTIRNSDIMKAVIATI